MALVERAVCAKTAIFTAVGQNYNLSKKEDAKVPQCPPDKEAAIMEALKHFHMV